ncbi:MAG: hypothetical protein RR454_06650 [Clostridia bacterium]
MLNNFKIAFFFVGAIVGAGFATGREIALYFARYNVFAPIFAGVILGALCFMFLLIGASLTTFNCNQKLFKTIEFFVMASCIITYLAMCSGAEIIVKESANLRYVGLLTGIFVAILCCFSLNFLKNINFIVVPLIIVLMLVLASNLTSFSGVTAKCGGLNAIAYASMNLLLGGFLVIKEGKKINFKNAVIIGVLVAIICIFMLVIMYYIVIINPQTQMPVFVFAQNFGLGKISALIIYFAIFSTLIGAGYVFVDFFEQWFDKKYYAIFLMLIMSFCGFWLPFDYFVNTFYPIISVLGVVFCIYGIVLFFKFNLIKKVELK